MVLLVVLLCLATFPAISLNRLLHAVSCSRYEQGRRRRRRHGSALLVPRRRLRPAGRAGGSAGAGDVLRRGRGGAGAGHPQGVAELRKAAHRGVAQLQARAGRAAAGGDRDLHPDRRCRRAGAAVPALQGQGEGGHHQGEVRRAGGGLGQPQARGGGAPAAEGVQELPHAAPARRLRRARGAELVEAARLRAAQAQLRLLLRHREAGDRHVQVVQGQDARRQGWQGVAQGRQRSEACLAALARSGECASRLLLHVCESKQSCTSFYSIFLQPSTNF